MNNSHSIAQPIMGREFDIRRIRKDFPLLQILVHGKPLVYLDNAATSQKPLPVIESLREYYETKNANVHRGVHTLSQVATDAYEEARELVREFIGAKDTREIVFVRGTTEAINLVAQSYGRSHLHQGDEIVVSGMEHHSNIVPWQLVCEQVGARLKVIPINEKGELILEEYEHLLNQRTKLVAVGHISNALGTVNPVAEMISTAHRHGIPVLVDGAQAVPHRSVDVCKLDADFYAFSGHKMFGPTGIGVLYGKASLLEGLPPYQGGGEMIKSVSFEKTTYNGLPHRFEAGTPNIAGAVGLGAAIKYLKGMDREVLSLYEDDLLRLATEQLEAVEGVRIVGTAASKSGVLSFVMDKVHPHDIGTVLDDEGIAIRTGHHCAQPVMQRFGIPATARASFAFYNTREEVEKLAAALHRVYEVFS
jgi:cysteine desulfurase / selenocysteine lyase